MKVDLHRVSCAMANLIGSSGHKSNLRSYACLPDSLTFEKTDVALAHLQTCHWLPSSDGGAIAVLTLPWKKEWWLNNREKLSLPDRDTHQGVWFATARDGLVPTLTEFMGTVPKLWNTSLPVTMIHMVPDSTSASISRQANNWGVIASHTWSAHIQGQTRELYANS